MYQFLPIGLFLIFFVGFPIGFVCLLYFVPKNLGYPRTGKFLALVFGLLFLILGLSTVFEDQLFTKDDAKELIEEQSFFLTDKFELEKNESTFAIGDYYHTFTLKISDHDKKNAISKIKNATNFTAVNSFIDQSLHITKNSYTGPKVIQNYETEKAFVREYFQPSGQEGIAPTFRRISISKTSNKLRFEDIDE